MRFKNKKVLVYGLGLSGQAVVTKLKQLNAKIFLFDKNSQKLKAYAKEQNINIFTSLDDIDIVVVSPGVRKNDEIILNALSKGIVVIGEMEFGYLLNKNNTYIAITGTNGKTTTTNMIYDILKEYKNNCYMLGNVGMPLSSILLSKKNNIALEVSSFQLEFAPTFCPKISIILNIAPDHLDRYEDFVEYESYKKSIIKNSKNDYLILNKDDKHLVDFVPKNCKIYYVSVKGEVKKGVYVYNNDIYYIDKKVNEKIMSIKELNVIGIHNLTNAMSATCACKLLKIPTSLIVNALKDFRGIEHRFEFVCEKNGVVVINDSKATNVASVVASYSSISNNSFLLMGGSSKSEKYDDLFKHKYKFNYLLFGDAAVDIYNTAKKYDKQQQCTFFDNMFEATTYALNNAKTNQMVVLSPACASFDSFCDFEDRGNQFKDYVRGFYEK